MELFKNAIETLGYALPISFALTAVMIAIRSLQNRLHKAGRPTNSDAQLQFQKHK